MTQHGATQGPTTTSRRLTDDERDEIVRRYQSREPISSIAAALGISRATIYYTLDALGVPRDRQPRSEIPHNVGDTPERTLSWALRTIMAQQQEIGRLREQLDQRARLADELVRQLQAASAHRSAIQS